MHLHIHRFGDSAMHQHIDVDRVIGENIHAMQRDTAFFKTA
jgi:hypothetical protein